AIAEGADWEYTVNLQRSRAYVAVQTIAFWANRYVEIANAVRATGRVPTRVCIGGGDCDSGQNLCKSTHPAPPGGTLTLADSPFPSASEGLGLYAQDNSSAVEAANSLALIFTSVHNPQAGSLRSISIDLGKPVPGGGGAPLGIQNARALVADAHAAGA